MSASGHGSSEGGLALTQLDEIFGHQNAYTFDRVSESSLNFAERFHFPNFEISGKYLLDCGFGVFPNRNVMEGFAGVAVGKEKVVFVRASRELRPDVGVVKVGPLSWDVIEPFKKLRVACGDNPYGLRFDVTVESSYPPSCWERGDQWSNGRLTSSGTIYFQMGRLSGWIEVDGRREEVTPERWRQSRDHSWGLRNAGAGEPKGLQPAARHLGLYHFTYAHFEDWGIVHHLHEHSDGTPWYFHAEKVYRYGLDKPPVRMVSLQHEAEFYPGSRRVKSGRLVYTDEHDEKTEISFEHTGTSFPLAVGGYGMTGAEWGQGWWMGPLWADGGSIDLEGGAALDRIGGLYDHACVLNSGGETGYGLIEVMPTGPYKPYGLG